MYTRLGLAENTTAAVTDADVGVGAGVDGDTACGSGIRGESGVSTGRFMNLITFLSC